MTAISHYSWLLASILLLLFTLLIQNFYNILRVLYSYLVVIKKVFVSSYVVTCMHKKICSHKSYRLANILSNSVASYCMWFQLSYLAMQLFFSSSTCSCRSETIFLVIEKKHFAHIMNAIARTAARIALIF